MGRHSPARWLAPLALLVSIGAVLLVVSASGGGSGDGSETTTSSGITASGTTETGSSTTETTTTSGPRTYVVKPGDTLTAIADATGVPLEQIEQLNDDIDSQSLTVGERIRLRP
jgi:LysM repeat protein